MSDNQTKILQSIMTMATRRGPDKSVCPSEIARSLFPEDWRGHMQEIRDLARELHRDGKVLVTQQGIPVDPDHIKGPVRITIHNPLDGGL